MKEKALASIVSIFALVAVFKPGKGFTLITNILEVYLNSLFSRPTSERYLDLFRQRLQEYIAYKNNRAEAVFEKFFEDEMDANCYILSREITLSNRMLVLLYLIEYIPYLSGKSYFNLPGASFKLVDNIARKLEIPDADFKDAMAFSSENYQDVSEHNPLHIITDNEALQIPGVVNSIKEGLNGQLIFIRIESTGTILFKVSGKSHFEMNDRKLYKRRSYILPKGAVIHADNKLHFYYNDIAKALMPPNSLQALVLKANNVTYRFSNGVYGIQPMSFNFYSGEIMAIMGGSGTGKTTLMNLLIGARKSYTGQVTINNVDVYSNPVIVKGYIGYVPQDDALIEELTAFENLYFIAGLSSRKLSREEKISKVEKVLKDLDLESIRDLKVGNPLAKIISGGQRKRLNIAIELIREPQILLLDEPTSGLSSSDSENIMQILKDTASAGRMVIINIHQPSSDVFKMFDKLLFIDQGGYAVYFGPAMEIPSYLKKSLKLSDAHENVCHTCGNINPDDIFQLIQTSQVSYSERKKPKRIYSPVRWHRRYMRNLVADAEMDIDDTPKLKPFPVSTPPNFMQYRIYSIRNVFTKIADYPYLLLSLLLPPLLGLLLSSFSHYIAPFSESYSFYQNDNIPAYLFMSVIVAMFVGIMSGSGEIIKDRKTLKRESFLNLSYSAYIFAKLSYLMILSAVQMLSYVLVSKWILEIPSGSMQAFIILWSTSVSSSIIGLVMSQIFKSMAAVYASVPFVLIPQILFSGAVIDFNKINPVLSSPEYVPLISETMISRWVYEAIAVTLYTESDYAKTFFFADQAISNSSYTKNFLLPEVEKAFFQQTWSTDRSITEDSADYKLIVNGIQEIEKAISGNYSPFNTDGLIKGEAFNRFVSEARDALNEINSSNLMHKDFLIKEMGSEDYAGLQKSTNKKLFQVLSDEQNMEKVKIRNDKFIRKMAPIYNLPEHRFGRSHLYAPAKRLGDTLIPTPLFNTLIIWIMSVIMLAFIIRKKPKI
jgi:ABC-type multidrug transport system ATPase subunit